MTTSNHKASDSAETPTTIVDFSSHYTQDRSFSKDPYLPSSLEEFQNHKIWVCFDVIPQKSGQTKKIPINPHTGNLAKINDPSTWGTFQEAKSMMNNLEQDPGAQYTPRHLGFALTPEINLVFIDLDHVIDKEKNTITPEAMEIVEKINSYTEYSQSNTGLHIYAKGKKYAKACKKDFLEVYSHKRFACITNSPYSEIRPLREATNEVDEICKQYLPGNLVQQETSSCENINLSMEDDAIIAKASAAKNGVKFKSLFYDGNIDEYGSDESSADLALMSILAFYTKDPEQLESLFSQSALGQREKWIARADYRKRTIDTAIRSSNKSYSPKKVLSSSSKIIKIIPGNLPFTVDAAEQAILIDNPGIYQRGGRLVRIIPSTVRPYNNGITRNESSYIIAPVTNSYLTEALTQKAQWFSLLNEKKEKRVDCPEKIASTLIARGNWKIPILRGFLYAPTLRPDGSLLIQPGYDPETGLLLLDSGIPWQPISEKPSFDEAIQALFILRELIKGFPFMNLESESVAISGIITALIRKSISAVPMKGFSAPKMGSGKSLLADVIALIATGKPNSVLSVAENEIEERKRLFSVLMEGDLMLCYDNIEKPFGSPSLCSALTQREFKDRILGSSATASVPTDSYFLATGNNLTIIGDLSTRTLLCQLDAQVEHPEERSFDIDLHKYIPQHRSQLVNAGLTILKAYHAAGRPPQKIKQFGRFEEWSDWVRSAIVWVGMPDPCLTRKEIEATDPVRAALGTLFSSWYALFGSFSIKIKALTVKANEEGDANAALKEALIDLAGTPKGEINERSLANKLKHYKHRIEQGYRLETAGELQGTTLWRVKKTD